MCYFLDKREPKLDINTLIYKLDVKQDNYAKNRTIIVLSYRFFNFWTKGSHCWTIFRFCDVNTYNVIYLQKIF